MLGVELIYFDLLFAPRSPLRRDNPPHFLRNVLIEEGASIIERGLAGEVGVVVRYFGEAGDGFPLGVGAVQILGELPLHGYYKVCGPRTKYSRIQ